MERSQLVPDRVLIIESCPIADPDDSERAMSVSGSGLGRLTPAVDLLTRTKFTACPALTVGSGVEVSEPGSDPVTSVEALNGLPNLVSRGTWPSLLSVSGRGQSQGWTLASEMIWTRPMAKAAARLGITSS